MFFGPMGGLKIEGPLYMVCSLYQPVRRLAFYYYYIIITTNTMTTTTTTSKTYIIIIGLFSCNTVHVHICTLNCQAHLQVLETLHALYMYM